MGASRGCTMRLRHDVTEEKYTTILDVDFSFIQVQKHWWIKNLLK
jgi:hypothetical protein